MNKIILFAFLFVFAYQANTRFRPFQNRNANSLFNNRNGFTNTNTNPTINQNTPTNQMTSQALAFTSWKTNYNVKCPTAADEAYRLGVFTENYNLIQSQNSDSTRTYQQGLTKFAGFTQ